MGRYTGPQCRLCRAEKRQLFLKGDRCKGPKCAITAKRKPPGMGLHSRTGKLSNYGLQLREKQKLRRIYGMLEKQFRKYFAKAVKSKGVTGEKLMQLLESRLDNIVYRMKFASSRKQGRQLVLHGHVKVNGRLVNVPSFSVRPNDRIEIKERSQKLHVIKESLKEYSRFGVSQWLEVDPEDIKEQLIVELYSK
jgi:small subunit ribosomal protein S4